ncbi:MAG: c-type cytochrome [Saprospiraceae bacterium]
MNLKSKLILFPIAFQMVCWSGVMMSCSKAKPLSEYLTQEGDSTTTTTHVVTASDTDAWMAPDTSSIPYDEAGALIRYGKTLVANTGAYFGPKGKVNHYANGMNCQNCHLKAGTKLYANSYSAVYSIYPKFRPRSGTIENLERRINDCMERSMNGKKLDSLSHEMRAMVAYINWVGKDVKKGVSPKGASVVDVPFLDRAADKVQGEIAFQKICATCHEADGRGKLNADCMTYIYPPLWGPGSYNTAAGMYRISRLAGFIKSNMPDQLSSHVKPILTDEQAWDIAAFISSMPRPEKKFNNDWPDITKKPIDLPFGPYADHFTEEQHKYGPYKEILAAGKANVK